MKHHSALVSCRCGSCNRLAGRRNCRRLRRDAARWPRTIANPQGTNAIDDIAVPAALKNAFDSCSAKSQRRPRRRPLRVWSAAVISAREKLAAGREKLHRQHESGSPGVQVCAHFTDLLEGIVVELFHDALGELSPVARRELEQQTAVVAHSGFGRRAMAPYSDIDVMLLHEPKRATKRRRRPPVFSESVRHRHGRRLCRSHADRGLPARDVGRHGADLAVRIAADCRQPAAVRCLRGPLSPHDAAALAAPVRAAEEARREERSKYGETIFLLEPNVKRSRGGLRDLQLIRWIGFIRYGEIDFDGLTQAGRLTKDEHVSSARARDFLLWLRNDLHFQHGKAEDVLDRADQLRIADLRNYPAVTGLLPVEQFMREYFQHTSDVREIAAHLAAGRGPRRLVAVRRAAGQPSIRRRFSCRTDGDFGHPPRPGQAPRRSGGGDAAIGPGESVQQARRARYLAGDPLGDDEPRAGRSQSAAAAEVSGAIFVAPLAAAAAGRIATPAARPAGARAAHSRA